MKQNRITDLPKLEAEKFENCFNVYQEADGKYFYNLIQNFIFPNNLPLSLFSAYTAAFGDTWPLVSFKNYQTTNLWWLILAANNIQDATKQPVNGETYKIPNTAVVQEVLSQIS